MKKGMNIYVMSLLLFAIFMLMVHCKKDDNDVNIDGVKGTVIDIDGNEYGTITIGSQVWMTENLRTTKYQSGISLSNVTDNTAWCSQASGAYSWYNNDIANKNTLGALYNFYSIVDSRKLCPDGWHVPTDAEWTTLTDYLEGSLIAGGKLKEVGFTHWTNPNIGANNSSGFSALPGGYRCNSSGLFFSSGTFGFWWSSSESSSTDARFRILHYGSAEIYRDSDDKNMGQSVRCVKNK